MAEMNEADRRALLDGLERTLRPFDDAYWARCEAEGAFPEAFFRAMAQGGWLGLALPREVGGAGLGVVEAALMMEAVARRGAMAAASAVHMNVFGPRALIAFGTQAQRARWLPGIVSGEARLCFAVTEPDSGLDTTRITTRAERRGDVFVVNGRKVWTSAAQGAAKILLLARTARRDPARPTAGLSLFFADLDRSRVEIREIAKMGRAAVESNALFIEDLKIPAHDLVGAEGEGFRVLLHSLNPERVLIAMEAVGIGLDAVRRAAEYAGEREVFGRPVGANQGVQHPLAAAWARLRAARLMALEAAALADAGRPCGVEANAAKYLAAEAAADACRTAMASFGGMGYARDYHVERLFREVMIPYLAPVSQQLALCHIAEKALGLPRSY